MKAWSRIARRECVAMARDRTLPWLGAVALGLLAVSVYAPLSEFRTSETWKTEAAAAVRRQWLTQGTRHPHSAAHYGVYSFRPLPPTAVLDAGVSEHIGEMQPLETHERHFAIHPKSDDATTARRMAGLAASPLAIALIPLLLILVGYGSVSGEREGGTLAQLMATGIAPGEILWGKALALLACAGGLSAGMALIEIPAVGLPPSPAVWGRFSALLMLHAVYASVWVFLVVAVSARARRSSTALAVLLAFWVTSTLLAPRVVGSLGRLVVKEPSVEEFRAAIQRDIATNPDGTEWVNTWSRNLIAGTLKRFQVSRIEDLPVGYAGLMLKGSDAHYEEVFGVHFQRLFELHQRQERWHMALSWLGPAIAARSVSQGFAGTDLAHAADFSNAAERYRRMFVQATNDAIEKLGRGTGWEVRVSRSYWESIPAFAYQTPGVGWAAARQVPGLVVLMIWWIAAALWLARSSARLRESVR